MGGALSAPKEPPKVILVPPFFERNFKGRSRFTHSSYDYMFSKRALKWLFSDYLEGAVLGKLYVSPPADPRISVKAKIGLSEGSMCVRWQPDPSQEGTFVDLRASPQVPGDATVRACLLHMPTGIGVFGNMPLAGVKSGSATQVGVRYSSPTFSCGAILNPQASTLTHLWLAGRYNALSLGAQLQPNLPLAGMAERVSQLQMRPPPLLEGTAPQAAATAGAADAGPAPAAAVDKAEQLAATGSHASSSGAWGDWLSKRSSVCVGYSPQFSTATGKGSFTAAAEVEGGHTLRLGFYQHMALTRNVYNPFENGDVVGITNYLDLGIQLVTPLVDSAPHTVQPGIRLAGAWQVNRGLLLKARVGTDALAVAAGFKLWGQPSFAAAVCAQYQVGMWQPRIGIFLQVENFGQLLFERSEERLRRGTAVTQEHEAAEEEIASAGGTRVQVPAGVPPASYNPKGSVTAEFL